MNIPLYQVDAFTHELFRGNPAAVCVLQQPIESGLMQRIAAENNLSETAFVYPEGDHFSIRWFTPKVEVELCGHATLATAFALWECEGYTGELLRLESRERGTLTVRKMNDGSLQLDFPSDPVTEAAPPENTGKVMGILPESAMQSSTDLLLIYEKEEDIKALMPDFRLMGQWDYRGIIATAPGNEVDLVSRFFGPAVGIDEDPVTGSAHCALVPYWSKVLNKKMLRARQLSERVGELTGIMEGDRVLLNGNGVLYLSGTIRI
jgi:PhzF family phenazine biosynthesis protein